MYFKVYEYYNVMLKCLIIINILPIAIIFYTKCVNDDEDLESQTSIQNAI